MKKFIQYTAQALVYAGFAWFIGYFSNIPQYTRIPEDLALVKFSFAHGAKPKGECHTLTREELLALAPNMRKPRSCPRERLPVKVELKMDGETLLKETLIPTGLHGDGPSVIYKRLVIQPGEHQFHITLNDTDREEGYDYISQKTLTIAPGQSLAIDFKGSGIEFVYE